MTTPESASDIAPATSLPEDVLEHVDSKLLEHVVAFVAQLEATLEATLAKVQQPLKTVISDTGKIVVTTNNEAGIPLYVNEEHLLSFKVDYHCAWDGDGEFLAVDSSSIHLVMPQVTEPLLHYDYVRNPRSPIPCAHFNVHGHRDELIYTMMAAEFRHQAKNRAKRVVNGKAPRLSQIHIPTGGHRFRPCLEDLVQMVIFEFAVDTKPTWRTAIEKGRNIWKENQLGSAVRDNPVKAAEQLERMGYKVQAPGNLPSPNIKKLSAY